MPCRFLALPLYSLVMLGCGDAASGPADLAIDAGVPDLVDVEDLGPEVMVDVVFAPPDLTGTVTYRDRVVAVGLSGDPDGGVSERPLPGVLVELEHGGAGVTTDPDGAFTLPGLSATGEVAFRVVQGAYSPQLVELTTAGTDVTGEVDLVPTGDLQAAARAAGFTPDLVDHGGVLLRVRDRQGGEYAGATVSLTGAAGGHGPLYLSGALPGVATTTTFASALYLDLPPDARVDLAVTPAPGDTCSVLRGFSPSPPDGGPAATVSARIKAGFLAAVSVACGK